MARMWAICAETSNSEVSVGKSALGGARSALLLLLFATAVLAGPPATPDAVDARRKRRATLAAHLGKDYALVLGQPLTDVLQPRQEGHFLYLTGVEDPDASLLLAGAKAKPLALASRRGRVKVREVLYLRDANPRFALFYGLRHLPGAKAAKALGVETARAAPRGGAGLARALTALLPKRARLHLPKYGGGDHATVREIRTALVTALAKSRPDIKFENLRGQLAVMRSVKDAYEIDCLRRAIDATVGALEDCLPRIRPDSTEAAVDGALLSGVRTRGARPAYSFVVGSGANESEHRQRSERVPGALHQSAVQQPQRRMDRLRTQRRLPLHRHRRRRQRLRPRPAGAGHNEPTPRQDAPHRR